MRISGKRESVLIFFTLSHFSDIETAKSANTEKVQNKEMQLRYELDSLLKQPLKYSSSLDVSRSYPLLFGDPDQLASRRSKWKKKII